MQTHPEEDREMRERLHLLYGHRYVSTRHYGAGLVNNVMTEPADFKCMRCGKVVKWQPYNTGVKDDTECNVDSKKSETSQTSCRLRSASNNGKIKCVVR